MASRSSEGIYAETLAVFDRSEHQYEPLTTPEVADRLDANRRTVYKRLRNLVERGELETKETGSNSRVWWRPPTGSDGTGATERRQEGGRRREGFRHLFEQLSQPIVEVEFEDRVPVVVDVNPAFEETFGYDSATIVGESLDDYIVPESDRDEARELNDRLVSGENLVSAEVTRRTTDGLREFRIETAIDADGSRGFGIYTDITEQKDRERELRAAHRFNEELVENAPFGMFRLDEKLRITYENPRAEEIIGLPDEKEQSDAIGVDFRELPPVVETGQAEIFSRVQDGETVEFEFPFESIYGESAYFTGRCVPLYRNGEFDGAILMAKDISERKERERELRQQNERMADLIAKYEAAETRYQSLFENCPVVFWEQDRSAVKERLEDLEREVEDLETYLRTNRDVLASLIEAIEFIDVNEKAIEYYGVDSKEALLENFGALLTEKSYEHFATVFARMANGETNFSLETEFQTRNGEIRDELVHVAVPDAYADDWSRMFVSVTDITEQKERQRELERTRDFLMEAERMGDIGVWELDGSGDITWTEGARRIHEIDEDYDLTVESAFEFIHPEDRPRVRRIFEDALESGDPYEMEARIVTADGNVRWVHNHGKPVDSHENGQAFRGFLQDITERKERERKLERMRDFLMEAERLGELGAWEFDDSGDAYWTEGTRRIHGVDDEFDPAVDAGIEFYHPEDRDTIRDAVEGALTQGESYDVQARLITVDGEERWIRTGGEPVDTHDDRQLVRGFIQDITEQKEHERDLERQREQLAALNELNDVVRGITHEVVEQSTREEIEQVVCERLAASDSYQFAWVVAGDSPERLQPRVEAGIEGYLNDCTPAPDPDMNSPTRKAVKTREIQVAQNLDEEPDSEPLSEYARAHGYRSVAAIPIVHRGTLYGVIGVHSERPEAFTQEEREVVGGIGEVVGHAIAALNRKRALMNEEFRKLEIRLPNLLESLNIPEQSHGTIRFDRRVLAGDGTYLLYGTAPAEDMHILREVGEQLSHWGELHVIDETDGRVRFEQEYSSPPIASTVANHGGYFDVGQIENGTYRAAIYLPPETETRPICDEIRDTYPGFEVVSQKQVSLEDPSPRHLLDRLPDTLTERQQAALEVGYYGGFFEWPRAMSGEEAAESLGIGPSTFHQHVRKAERKLLDLVFANP